MGIYNKNSKNDVAIVGIACQFPKARDYSEFWNNLVGGKDCIEEIKRWDVDQFYSENYNDNKSISKWMGQLEDLDKFDNNFFNISPREAIEMDPQQRILLQETWHCIEDSGIALSELQKKKTSVYITSLSMDTYNRYNTIDDIDIYTGTGTYPFMLSNRLSYFLNLTGESKTIDTACSGSITVLYDAQRNLIAKDSDYVLVGGVNIFHSPVKYFIWSKNRMLSPDGKCKTFDKDANGFVPGEGVGVLLLQRYEDAIRDNNHIYGVIKGCAINHVGHASAVTAPKVEAQRDAIISAYKEANCSANTVSYIETHGTGTSLGDPIEVEALRQAFEIDTTEKQFCQIGSVKTNVGHLINAAAMPSVIKVLMMMKFKKVPPTLNLNVLNPMINIQNTPFYTSDSLKDWIGKDDTTPLRAGITSIGLGGVSGHLLLEEYKPEPLVKKQIKKKVYPFLLSAKSETSLRNLVDDWKIFLSKNRDDFPDIEDTCLTLLTGRETFNYRIGNIVSSIEDIKKLLEESNIPFSHSEQEKYFFISKEIMLNSFIDYKDFFMEHAIFHERLETLLKRVEELNVSFKKGKDFYRGIWKEKYIELNTFILQYTIISTLKELGINITRTTGEKKGIWVSLALSEIVSIDEILIYLFGQEDSIQFNPTRGTIAFYDPIHCVEIKPLVFNSDYLTCILSELQITDEAFNIYLQKAQLLYPNQYTFRKYMNEWDECLKYFNTDINTIIYDTQNSFWSTPDENRRKLLIVVIIMSSLYRVNKKWNIAEEKIMDDDKLYDLLNFVINHDFSKNELISLLFDYELDYKEFVNRCMQKDEFESRILESREDYKFLFEYSKNTEIIENFNDWVLKVLKKDISLQKKDMKTIELIGLDHKVLDSNNNGLKINLINNFSEEMNNVLVKLWLSGENINWRNLYQNTTFNKVNLPVYSFEKKSFWLSEKKKGIGGQNALQLSKFGNDTNQNCIDEVKNRKQVFLHKQWQKHDCTKFKEMKKSVLILSTEETIELAKLIQIFMNNSDIILYKNNEIETESNQLEKNYEGFIDLIGCGKQFIDTVKWIGIVQSQIMKSVINKDKIQFLCITKGIENLENNSINFTGATNAGLYRMLQSEYSNVSSRHIDFSMQDSDAELAMIIVKEYLMDEEISEVCYRGGIRYKSCLMEIDRKIDTHEANIFNTEHALWITGGTRGIGYLIAQYFVNNHGVKKLILTGREEIPPREDLKSYVNTPIENKIIAIQKLEEQGVKVITLSTDLTDGQRLIESLNQVKQEFGSIGGVIHCAGLTDGNNPAFIRKNVKDVQKVLEPKVQGLNNLFHTLKDEPFKFFLLFSSVSAAIPSLSSGQSDYAMANTYMDYFATYYNKKYPIISIEWPSWKESGMGEVKNKAYQETGLLSHTDKEGLLLFEQCIAHTLLDTIDPVIMPAFVDSNRWNPEKLLDISSNKEVISGYVEKKSAIEINETVNANAVYEFLTDVFCEELSIENQDMEIDTLFQELGIDSIILVQIIKQIEHRINNISIDPVSMLEYPTIRKFSDYLFTTFPNEIKSSLLREDLESKEVAEITNYEEHVNDNELMDRVEAWLQKIFSDELNVVDDDIDRKESFQNFGIDSIFLQQLIRRIEKDAVGINLEPDVFFEYQTIVDLAKYFMINHYNLMSKMLLNQGRNEIDRPLKKEKIESCLTPTKSINIVKQAVPENHKGKVAVIGMACHFPEASDIGNYWNNLINEKDSIKEIPKTRWNWEKNYTANEFKEGRIISKWGGFLDNIELFDAKYFGVKDSLAKQMDPLQRQWLEVSMEALSDAGFGKQQVWNKNIGVYVGARTGSFLQKNKVYNNDTIVGNGQNFIATHLAHFLNLKGPNMVIDTACSSSLTAIHLAVKSIQDNESEMAIAGGVEILDESMYHLLSAAKILSPDGRCKTFDSSANGIGLGEGCGVLILKSLDLAIKDNNKIYGVIDGSALNNDGNTMGITTPNPEAQRLLIQQAITNANIEPETISYIETHGTGTLIGDPIELKGLNTIFKSYTSEKHFCGVGSVKSNIGHLLSASGAASVIKVMLSMIHRQIPPTINCNNPNPRFDFEDSSLFIVKHPTTWNGKNNVLRAGISAFGLGGDNAHIIVSNEEIPDKNIATMKPINKKIEFNRQRYWIEDEETSDYQENNSEEDEFFSDFFSIRTID